MKRILMVLVFPVVVAGCSGPGGPAQRAGAAVDEVIYDVGRGIETTGQKIKNASQ